MAGSTRLTDEGSAGIEDGCGRKSEGTGVAPREPRTIRSIANPCIRRRAMNPSPGPRRLPVAIVLLIVGLKLARLEWTPPRLVLPVPAHRLGQRLVEAMARPQAQGLALSAVHR